jgi:formate/nitrite transporter
LVYLSGQYQFGGDVKIGFSALSIAAAKAGLDPVKAFFLGLLCNALVCLAVWMSYSARTTIDKITTIIFPITAFVAMGFEHSIANMYFIPVGLAIKYFDPAFTAKFIEVTGTNLDKLNVANFFINNIIPVTLGNIVGGTVFVAGIYWMIFLKDSK